VSPLKPQQLVVPSAKLEVDSENFLLGVPTVGEDFSLGTPIRHVWPLGALPWGCSYRYCVSILFPIEDALDILLCSTCESVKPRFCPFVSKKKV